MTTGDPGVVPNDGVETNLTGYPVAPLPADSSLQIGIEVEIGAYDAVFGLFQNTTIGPVAFFDVFTVPGDQSVHLAYDDALPILEGTAYEFRLDATKGTEWTLTVNGGPLGSASDATFDFGAPNATSSNGLSFSEVALGGPTLALPAVVLATVAFAFHRDSGWYLPNEASSSFRGGPNGSWGANGRNEAPELAPGEIRAGPSIPGQSNGTPLWSGGPVPVRLSIGSLGPEAIATAPLEVNATVRDGSGNTIAGVPVSVSDALGGTAESRYAVTDANGSAQLVLVLPNVSAPTDDVVSVTSAILGYPGATGASLVLDPPVHLTLSASPAEPEVVVNGTVTLTFRAIGPDGSVVPHTYFGFSSTLGGRVAETYGESGSDGLLSIEFVGGPSPSTSTVVAQVDEPGAWGHLNVTVRIVPAPRSLFGAELPALVLGGIAALVAVGAYLVYRRARRRPPLPELKFLPTEGPREGPATTPPADRPRAHP